MPPRTKASTMQAEEALARRIASEREKRGWSPAGLASRLTKIGCPMTQSGIWKIENGQPRRRISFDEAVAFSQVFDMGLEELTFPKDVQEAEEAARLVREISEAVGGIGAQVKNLREISTRLAELLTGGNIKAIGAANAVLADPAWWSSSDGASEQDRVKRARQATHPSRIGGGLTQLHEWLTQLDTQWQEATKVNPLEEAFANPEGAPDGKH